MLKGNNIRVAVKKKEILRDISFSVNPNRITVVLGKNGSGKSTLISCINQSRKYDGTLWFDGKELSRMTDRERAKSISILSQVLANPHILTEDLVKMGRNPYLDLGHHFTKEDELAVERGIQAMGIQNLRGCYVDNLSGGERQKVYLAMILAQDADVIIMDEPTTFMDLEYQAEFLKILKKLKEEYGKTVVVVLHDINAAMEIADDILILKEGKIVFQGSKEEILRKKILEQEFHVTGHNIEGKILFTI